MQQIQTIRKGKRSFSLSSLPNLQQWLDASKLTGLNDSDVITNWPDSSGKGRNITSVAGTPQYKTNIFGNLPAVDFEASQGMTGAYSITSGNFSIITVCRLTSTSNSIRRLINGDNNWLIGPWLGQWRAYNNANFIDSGLTLNTNPIIVIYTSGAAQKLFVGNINTVFSSTGGGYPALVNFGIVGGNAENFLGNLAEVGIFNRELSLEEVKIIFNGLGSKWGA